MKRNVTISRRDFPSFNDINWKQIKGWNDYFIHPNGYVKSIKTDINYKKFISTTTERILKMFTVKGYSSVNLVSDKRRKSARVHRLVAESFIPNPKNKPCINHKNGITTDSSVGNLEWCTYAENEKYSYSVLGKISPATKLFSQDKYKIRKIYADKKISQRELAEIYKVNVAAINRVLRGFKKC